MLKAGAGFALCQCVGGFRGIRIAAADDLVRRCECLRLTNKRRLWDPAAKSMGTERPSRYATVLSCKGLRKGGQTKRSVGTST
jgi:hypothetical protein